MHEAEDGHDAIEWLAVQPWSDGKVGMIGGSYLGWVQWWAASEKPAHLVTIIPNVAPPDPHYNIPYEYGAFFLLGSIWWAQVLESEATAELSGVKMAELGESDYSKVLNTLPVIDLDKILLKKENPYWRDWIRHGEEAKFWQKANFLEKLKNVDIPVFHQSGWFDGDGIGTKLNYQKMKSFGHANQKMIVGPWGHTDTVDAGSGRKGLREGRGARPAARVPALVRFLAEGRQERDRFGAAGPAFCHGQQQVADREHLPAGGNRVPKAAAVERRQGQHRQRRRTAGLAAPGRCPPSSISTPTTRQTRLPIRPSIRRAARRSSRRRSFRPRRRRNGEGFPPRNGRQARRHPRLSDRTSGSASDLLRPVSAVIYASSSAKDTDWFVTLERGEAGRRDFRRCARGKSGPATATRLSSRKRSSRARSSLTRLTFGTPGSRSRRGAGCGWKWRQPCSRPSRET